MNRDNKTNYYSSYIIIKNDVLFRDAVNNQYSLSRSVRVVLENPSTETFGFNRYLIGYDWVIRGNSLLDCVVRLSKATQWVVVGRVRKWL